MALLQDRERKRERERDHYRVDAQTVVQMGNSFKVMWYFFALADVFSCVVNIIYFMCCKLCVRVRTVKRPRIQVAAKLLQLL